MDTKTYTPKPVHELFKAGAKGIVIKDNVDIYLKKGDEVTIIDNAEVQSYDSVPPMMRVSYGNTWAFIFAD